MKAEDTYGLICGYIVPELRAAMKKVPEEHLRSLTEIRLYSRRRAAYIYPDKVRYLTNDGRLSASPEDSRCITVTPEQLRAITDALCRYSVHSCSRELREGFFVLGSGVRVGASGSFSQGGEPRLTEITGLNFRISRSIPGCGEELFRITGGCRSSILICGGVNSGKTTLLRDLCRLCGNRMKTVLIDERDEIAALSGGGYSNDIGELTDVISGSGRAEGIAMAIRTLSPEMIFCDEIAGEKDTEAILSGHGSGVRFTATLHAESYDDIFRRKAARPLIESGVFSYAVILEGGSAPSKIREVRRLKNVSEDRSSGDVHISRSSSRSISVGKTAP